MENSIDYIRVREYVDNRFTGRSVTLPGTGPGDHPKALSFARRIFADEPNSILIAETVCETNARE